MMADSQETGGGAKELFQLITHKPALLITVLLGGGLVVFLLIRNGAKGANTTTSSVGDTATSAPDYSSYQTGYDMGYQRGSYSVPTATSSSGTPPPSVPPIPPTNSTTITSTVPLPTTTVQANNPQVSQLAAYTSSNNTGPTSSQPYLGLLGPNINVNFQAKTYQENGQNVKLPSYVGALSQGDQGRIWYIDRNTGAQDLLTSGYGPGVTNSGFMPNSPQNTPPKKAG